MAQKTYAPTMVKMLKRVLSYTIKHAGPLSAALSSNQNSSLGRINVEIQTYFANVSTNETP